MFRRLLTGGFRKRYDVINYLIRSRGYHRYLEIGTRFGRCLERVRCAERVGVDPSPRRAVPGCKVHPVTSDVFFERNTDEFDLVLIDGLHLSEQVLRDFYNSLNVLAGGGAIILHDCNPQREEMQSKDPSVAEAGNWSGDVWKCIVYVRRFLPTLFCRVFNFDTGTGVVIPPRRDRIELTAEVMARATHLFDHLSWQDLVAHRDEYLGLIRTKRDFLRELDRWSKEFAAG